MVPNRKFSPPGIVVSRAHEASFMVCEKKFYLPSLSSFFLSFLPSFSPSLHHSFWNLAKQAHEDRVHIRSFMVISIVISACCLGRHETHLYDITQIPVSASAVHIRAVCLDGACHPALPIWVDVKIAFPKLGVFMAGWRHAS